MPTTFAMIAVAAGSASALVYASLLTASPAAFLLAYLAQLPLFAVGLWMGKGAVAIASIAAIIVTFIAGGFVFSVIYTVANAAPVIVVVRQALLWRPAAGGSGIDWYPPGSLVMTLLALSSALFAGVALSFAGQPGGLEGTLEKFIVEAFRRLRAPAGLEITNLEDFASQIARLFAGVVAVSWMIMTLVNGTIAQALVRRAGVNRRPSPTMADIELPAWLMGLTGIFAVGSLFGSFASINMMVILVAVYALAGLGVVHSLVRNLNWRGMALGAVYGSVIVFGWPIVVLAVLGLVEPYANLKARGSKGSPPNP